jgi:hypothetical protein
MSTYVLDLAHIKSPAYVGSFKSNTFPQLKPMLAAHLRAADSNPMKFGIITGIRTVVQWGLRLEQQKLQRNHHEST